MRTSLLKLLATVLALAMLAVASGSDASDENVAETPATSEETETSEDGMADDPGTIVDVAVGAGSFTTLVAAVTEAGLVDIHTRKSTSEATSKPTKKQDTSKRGRATRKSADFSI